jgi:hypothetical protein
VKEQNPADWGTSTEESDYTGASKDDSLIAEKVNRKNHLHPSAKL